MAFDYVKFLAENKLTATSKLNEKAKILNENYIDLRPINNLFNESTDSEEMYYIHDKEGMEEPIGPFTKEKANQELIKHGRGWKLIDAKSAKEIWSYLDDSEEMNEIEEDDDIEDVQPPEEEFDFMAPGKKDEFDTDDDVEPAAKDVKGGEEVVASGKQGKLIGLIKQKDAILSKLKSGQITIDQYKQEIGNIPLQIKNLQASIDQDLNVSDDTEEEI